MQFPMATVKKNALYIPERWKESRICPVLKKGDPSLINNYRPISILSNLSKVFEMILYKYIQRVTEISTLILTGNRTRHDEQFFYVLSAPSKCERQIFLVCVEASIIGVR
jgi:hypothetical protein